MTVIWSFLFHEFTYAYTEDEDPTARIKLAEPAYGIYETFGRWVKPIILVYDPDEAPDLYSDPSRFLELLESAAAIWEHVCGIQISIEGVSANAPEDEGPEYSSSRRDGKVRVRWEEISEDTFASAAIRFGSYDYNRGYFPYHDGYIRINSHPDMWTAPDEADEKLLTALVHEVGHLLGLGHSDDPNSVMYANPYNHLEYPREDDIRTVQTLYGKGPNNLDPARLVNDWAYRPPKRANDDELDQFFNDDLSGFHSRITVHDRAITNFSKNTSYEDDENVWILVQVHGIPAPGGPENYEVVVVDPGGYVLRKEQVRVRCGGLPVCSDYTYIGRASVVAAMPGTWKVYVVGTSPLRKGLVTYDEKTFTVETRSNRNEAPVGFVSSEPLPDGTLQFSLTAYDHESDSITVRWHLPGSGGVNTLVSDSLQDGGTSTVTLPRGRASQFFVELSDNSPRYGSGSKAAGSGYRTLLRIDLAENPQNLFTDIQVSASTDWNLENTVNGDLVYDTGVQSEIPKVVNNKGLPTTAVFGLGALDLDSDAAGRVFRPGDKALLAGAINPQSGDLGKPAEIFVVVRTTTAQGSWWSYRDSEGRFEAWDYRIPTLEPAYVTDYLEDSGWLIYAGRLQPGRHKLFIGYRVLDTDLLHYTAVPLIVDVVE